MQSDHDRAVRADETTTLGRFLDEQRWAVLRKAEGLTQAQAGATHPPSDLTIGGLVKHLALCEHTWFAERFAGEAIPRAFDAVDWVSDPDWELRTGATDPLGETLSLYREACERSRAIVATAASLEELSAADSQRGEGRFSLRWILLHMIEETARHAGHADLIRQSIDGATGD